MNGSVRWLGSYFIGSPFIGSLFIWSLLLATPSRAVALVHGPAKFTLGNGSLSVFWNDVDAAESRLTEGSPATTRNGTDDLTRRTSSAELRRQLIIHFHGAPATVRDVLVTCDRPTVLAVVNFPGLSSAYSRPFAADPQLFDEICDLASRAATSDGAPGLNATDARDDFASLRLSSFSAGYGAIREILKTDTNFQRIDGLVFADSIYAGLQEDVNGRRVNPDHMKDFLRFAQLAVRGERSLLISHSSQATPYASTTETADYLLSALGMTRRHVSRVPGDFSPTSRAERGNFRVLGFAGTEANDHLEHLRKLDVIWRRFPMSSEPAGLTPRSTERLVAQAATDVAEGTRANSELDSRAAERLRSAIEYEVKDKNLPAFSIALVDSDRTVWAAGFGFEDAERKRPATADTVYRVGSVSKLFTDIAIMQLVEQGKLELDAPIQTFLPAFRPQNPYETPITLRQLMSHRSGLVRESPVGNYFDPSEPSLAATVASLNQTRLVYPPLSRIKYSNAAVAVVGAVLERHAGVSHPAFVRRQILQPLGMNQSSFHRADVTDGIATGWMWTYDGRRFVAPTFALGTGPAGNLYSSVNDLGLFLACLFREGKTESGSLLSPSAYAEMTTPVVDSDGKPQRFGLGFHIRELDGYRKIGHGGAVYGFSTQLEALPERKLGVAAASALDGSNGVVTRLADYALRLMIAVQDKQELPAYRVAESIPPARARRVAGEYLRNDGEKSLRLEEYAGEVYLQQGEFERRLGADVENGGLVVDDVFGFGKPIEFGDGNARVTYGGEVYQRRASDEPPDDIPEGWRGLVGEYGWDHNTLYILEEAGRLYALIEWFYYYPLEQVDNDTFRFPNYGLYHGEGLRFQRDANGEATEVVAAEVRFIRRNVGTKDGETFKIDPVKPVEALRVVARDATPPREQGQFRTAELEEPSKLDPSIRLDIRYATTNNFMGAVFYRQPRAFLQRPAAEALVRANARLREYGLGVLIHDGYRPWYVTKMFWDATPTELKDFVANPANGSRHNRGCAVDLTLYDLATGEPIPMVATYDEFSPRSYPRYPGGTSRQRWYRSLLRRTMEAESFSIYEYEWWHFDFRDWKKYRIGNATFEDLLSQ